MRHILKKGDKVNVTLHKNGYWHDMIKGVLIDENADKYQVDGKNGKRWYKKENVSPRKVNSNFPQAEKLKMKTDFC